MSVNHTEKDSGLEQTLYGVIRHVRPLHRHLANTVQDQLLDTGITVGMRAVLEQLHDGGPQTVPQIGRALFLKRQVVQRTVNDLLELELVRRVSNPSHRGSPLIELTSEGRGEFTRIKGRESTTLAVVAQELPREDVEACLRVVEHLTERFREINEQSRRGSEGQERQLPASEEFVD